MKTNSNDYHYRLADALDDSARAQQEYNRLGHSLCLQHWATSLNSGRAGSVDKLPSGVIQLIHYMTEKCDIEGVYTKCFCIKKGLDDNKVEEVQFFVTNHIKGECPHRTYEEES